MSDKNILNIAVTALPEMDQSWVEILSALLTPSLAFFGIFLAYQQWKINKRRFRHETYEKRLEIYKITNTHLSKAFSTIITNEDAINFKFETTEAAFLFDDDVINYLDEIYKKSIDLATAQDNIKILVDDSQRSESIAKKTELVLWHAEQIGVAREMFKKKMKINVT